MREEIYLAPNANASELLKSLALHGRNCFNLRIVSAVELARIALMRCAVAVDEDFLSSKEETSFIFKAVNAIKENSGNSCYLKNPSYSDIREIKRAIRTLRSLVSCDNEANDHEANDKEDTFENEDSYISSRLLKGTFREKNEFLIGVYRKYKELLVAENKLDTVVLIRKAIERCSPLEANIDFHTLKEYPLSPLEQALIEKLSGKKVNDLKTDLKTLFKLKDSPLNIKSFKNCYGAANEVETILDDIYSGKKLDECTVALASDSDYTQLFFDYAMLYDIPVSFGCGIPIINSNPAKLLELYRKWASGGIFSPQALQNMLNSSVFNRSKLEELYPQKEENFSFGVLTEVLRGLRLTNDEEKNQTRQENFRKALADEEQEQNTLDDKLKDYQSLEKKKCCIPYLEILANELSLTPDEFIKKYAYIRKKSETESQRLLMSLDMVAQKMLCDELKLLKESGLDKNSDDLYKNALSLKVPLGASQNGHLHITGIDGALCAVRKNLYIAGLSASRYPGSPRQNYLILDNDLSQFGEEAEYLKANSIIEQKKNKLLNLVEIASSLKTDIFISFAGLNVSELKQENPSSLLYRLLRDCFGKDLSAQALEKNIVKVKYFEPAISCSRKILEAYCEDRSIENSNNGKARDNTPKDKLDLSWALEKEYSPTALEKFFKCKRLFMFSKLLNLPEANEENIFEVIAATELGTLVHALMEQLANQKISEDKFLELAEKHFDRFLDSHPALIDHRVTTEKDQFLAMMTKAYQMDGNNRSKVILKEEDIRETHSTGIRLHGYPDRVEELEDGSVMVVDYKTSKKQSHKEDDIDTCLQILIYAYLLELHEHKVSEGEYRYLRLNKKIKCRYNEEMKKALEDRLNNFKQHILKADFPDVISESKIDSTIDKDKISDACKYCKYRKICTTAQGDEDDE